MGDIVSLRQARKRIALDREQGQAAANRAAFGRTKAEKTASQKARNLEEKRLDAHVLTSPADTGSEPSR